MPSPKRLLWRLYPSYLLIIVAALAAVTVYATVSLRAFYRQRTAETLEGLAQMAAFMVAEPVGAGDFMAVDRMCKEIGLRTAARYTVVLDDGRVIGDSVENPALMENHAYRPEVLDVLRESKGKGTSTRYSDTLRAHLLYVAVPLRRAGQVVAVIRVARTIGDVQAALRAIYRRIAWAGVLIAFFAAGVSLLASSRITRPLEDIQQGAERFARGDLTARLGEQDSTELGALARTMNLMAAQLADRFAAITRQRNELEAILKSMTEGVIAVDSDERLITINEAAVAMFGIAMTELKGKPIQELVRHAALHELVRLTLGQGGSIERDIVFYNRDNGERSLQAHGSALHDHAGRHFGAVIVLNDITRLRQLENLRREFVANVSHELRTPITSMKGFVETLLDGAMHEPEHAERFLNIIRTQTDRLNAIIDDLLLLSQVELRKDEAVAEQDFEELALLPIMHAAVQVCAGKAADKRIAVTVTGDAQIKARINPRLLELALVNLLGNALSYSQPGSPVAMTLRREGGRLALAVQDHGCGIAKNHLERIFERFYRVDRSRSREAGGTGLGLAIVKHIVQAHGGVIVAASVFGEGSTFTILLPEPTTTPIAAPSASA